MRDLLMKCFVAAAFFVTAPAQSSDLTLDINGLSFHGKDTYQYQGDTHKYNESNPGLGLTYRVSRWLDVSAGFYENSYYRKTAYGSFRIGHAFAFGDFAISPGIMAGYATGYDKTPVEAGRLSPVVLPNLRMSYRNVGVTIGYVPKITQSDVVAVSVVTLQLNIKLWGKP